MSTSDPPRPTSLTPPARFTASLDKLSSTTRTSNNGNGRSKLPGGIDIPFPDLPLRSLHSLLSSLVTRTLPSALSLFLIIYLSSPHTRTDGLRGYVPVGIVVGRVVGEVGGRRLGLGSSSSGGLGAGAGPGGYGLDGRGDLEEMHIGGLNDSDSNSGGDRDDEEKRNIDTNTNTNTDMGTTSTSVSPSPSPSPSTSTSSPSTTTTRFRGKKAEILSGALEAALALGLSMAVSGSGGVGLGLLVSFFFSLLVVWRLFGGFTVVVLFVERGRGTIRFDSSWYKVKGADHEMFFFLFFFFFFRGCRHRDRYDRYTFTFTCRSSSSMTL